MRVPVHIFADDRLLEAALGDRSLTQAINASTLPGLVSHVNVMPDVHQGYGFPIGGVAATKLPDGVISPGGIGYDINCGVRLLSSKIPFEAAESHLNDLASSLYANCPSGVGVKGSVRLTFKQLEAVCRLGSEWALKNGFARTEDLPSTEEGGRVSGADPSAVSERAMQRGRPQLGTLGAGNHFIEIDIVEQIFDQEGAQAMGLKEGYLALQIHCGSRGFGHQICSDYVRELQGAVRRYGIQLPDRELVCAPLSSKSAGPCASCQKIIRASTCREGEGFRSSSGL
jgi:tRNA-splicing ligase RtcB